MGEKVRPPHVDDELERRFDDAMMEIYQRSGAEVGYWAGRYLQMLKRRGGLATARHLLAARTTSDGYARLREAGRLDLTVEAYVLRPEYASLFTERELESARSRLAFYHQVMAERAPAKPAEPELLALLAEVSSAPPGRRIEYRDRIAAFGPDAVPVLEDWVADGNSAVFGVVALEAIGRSGDPGPCVRALGRLRARQPGVAGLAEAAIDRLKA
jgi:hypothetical protein